MVFLGRNGCHWQLLHFQTARYMELRSWQCYSWEATAVKSNCSIPRQLDIWICCHGSTFLGKERLSLAAALFSQSWFTDENLTITETKISPYAHNMKLHDSTWSLFGLVLCRNIVSVCCHMGSSYSTAVRQYSPLESLFLQYLHNMSYSGEYHNFFLLSEWCGN